jgi:formylglycine-generating enzyme required for sulfatase activity
MKPENETGAAIGQRHVFISFASSDAAVAHRAVTSLEQSGLRCWFSDRDIEPATSYPAVITDAVKNSGAVVLLLTEAANQSPHVVREIELAFNARRPILPVRIGGAAPSSDLQYFLSRSQWLDAGASLDEAELARVESRLRALLRGGLGAGGLVIDPRSWRRIAAMTAVVVAGAAAFLVWNERRARDQPVTAAEGDPVTATEGEPAPAAVTVKVNVEDGEPYVWVPPGRFIMGCSAGDPACDDDEKPAHTVEIQRGFWLARTEVTEQRFRTRAPAGDARGASSGDALPATEVSWAAAKSYCEAVGGRLPTEAEWEYAARAGTSTRYYDSLPAIAWFSGNSDDAPHAVGAKTPNAFGLHDMLGNVSEWVLDRYYNAYDETSDPADVEEPLAGNASGVARGGSWVSDEHGVRVSRRLEMPPDAEEPHIGFRCAADAL